MSEDILIHIGFPKTGSSFLQHHFFLTDEPPFGIVPRRHAIIDRVRMEQQWLFDANPTRAVLDEIRASIVARGRYPVLSLETLSGATYAGAQDTLRTRDRLHAVAPDARILIVIREQDSMILSTHNQFIRQGGSARLKAFLNPPMDGIARFHPAQLRYHHIIEAYRQRFGEDRVMVLPFEQLREDRRGFLDAIHGFCGLSPLPLSDAELAALPHINPATPPVGLAIKRRLNYLFALDRIGIDQALFRIGKHHNDRIKGIVKRIGRRVPASWNDRLKQRDRQQIRSEIEDYYALSNARTAELTGLDLARYGYRLP